MQTWLQSLTADLGGWGWWNDPGWIRFELAAKGLLAAVTSALVTALLLKLLSPAPTPSAVIFSLFATYICFLLIRDAQPVQRRITVLLALIPLLIAFTVASFLPAHPLLMNLALLTFMVLAYFLRRYGARVGELTTVLAMIFYLTYSFTPSSETLPQFYLSSLVIVASVYFWQFIIRKYDPQRNLRQAITGFFQETAEFIGAVKGGLETRDSDWEAAINASLRKLSASHKIIARQLAAVIDPIAPQRNNLLLLQLYNVENGLKSIVEGAFALSRQNDDMPPEIRASFFDALSALQNAVASSATPEQIAALTQASQTLQARARASLSNGKLGAWADPVLQISTGGNLVSQAVQQARALTSDDSNAGAPPSAADPASAKATPAPPSPPHIPVELPLLGKVSWHPATILAIQVFVAVGLTMLVAGLLGLSNSRWAYLSAFVIIAGSAGESVRKMGMRVLATLVGVFLGGLLSYFVRDISILPVLLALGCIFMALYTGSVTYTWLVFWNTMLVAFLDGASGELSTFIVTRPVNVLLGASIAALVAIYVLPQHSGARFKGALAQYLRALDRYLSTFTASAATEAPAPDITSSPGITSPPEIEQAGMKVSATFDALSQTFPSIAFEQNPLSQAQSPLAAQSIAVTALNTYITELTAQLPDGSLVGNNAEISLIQTAQTRIHDNLQALIALLTGQPAPPLQTLSDLRDEAGQVLISEPMPNAAEPPTMSRRIIFNLSRINRTIIQLADEFNAADTPAPQSTVASR